MKDYKVTIKDDKGNIRQELARGYDENGAMFSCRKFIKENETILYAEIF